MYGKDDFARRLPRTKLNDSEEYRRDDIRKDCGRVIHSYSFRKLAHKTQLFPGNEIDFFRNRLTHSLEVAQIAKSIALQLNHKLTNDYHISPDICEIAGLIHDIGHPPFGHKGERALNYCMKDFGGFEGNAQTIRILTRIEKRERLYDDEDSIISSKGGDLRLGLNLSARVLASALKYDKEIKYSQEKIASDSKPNKGYYTSNANDIEFIKKSVLGNNYQKLNTPFKTIECQIMDLADDIANATSDLEDAFKAGFLTPHDMLAPSDDVIEGLIEELAEKQSVSYNYEQILNELHTFFGEIIDMSFQESSQSTHEDFINLHKALNNYSQNGYIRTRFISNLIKTFINGVHIVGDINHQSPCLLKIDFTDDVKFDVYILKYFTYKKIISSPMLQVAETRGDEIIEKLFHKIEAAPNLLPEDFKNLYYKINDYDEAAAKRVICDFIAGMTDRYALEYYCRLFAMDPQSIFKPL